MHTYELGNIPFFFDMQKVPENPSGLPDKIPFTICEDENGVITQKYMKKTAALLEEAYTLGSNLSGLMAEEEIGNNYAQDFKSFILNNLDDIHGKRVLDIGCGTGYLLKLLRDEGAIVEGVEPGDYGRIGREQYNIKIKQGFFDKNDYREKYDIVIFYSVLEHIADYKNFLLDVIDLLSENGKIFISVPNCEEYLKCGDISVFTPEHWNYFTGSTLERVVRSVGLAFKFDKSGYGGAIYGCCDLRGTKDDERKIKDNISFSTFQEEIEIKQSRIKKFFEEHAESSIGIYCPCRIINYYDMLPTGNIHNLRFFDDDSRFHELYFPSIPIKMENYSDLLKDPVEIMLIATTTFADIIKKKCMAAGITKCYVLKDI